MDSDGDYDVLITGLDADNKPSGSFYPNDGKGNFSQVDHTSPGFDQCYNGQAAVNEDMVIVGAYGNAHANYKQEFIPTVDMVPPTLGEISNEVANTGYFSETNIDQCLGRTIGRIISTAREKHNSFPDTVFNREDGPTIVSHR